MVRFLLVVTFVLGFSLSVIPRAHSADERVVSTVAGDTFDKIALRELGSAGLGRLLAEYNNISYLGALRANRQIKIPVSEIPQTESLSTVFVKGDVRLWSEGNSSQQRVLSAGSEIFVKDHILTGKTGYVSMMVPSGSVVNIQPDSLVVLRTLVCSASDSTCDVELETLEGALSGQITQRDGQPTNFRVRTPHATAAVRGTTIDVDASDHVMLIGVTEGEVELNALESSTQLTAGLGAKTLAGEAPGTPIPLLPAASFKRIPQRISVEDTIGWHNVLGAVSYQFLVASDPAMDAQIYSTTLQNPESSIRLLPASSYYVRVRALDVNGLRGFGADYEINVVDLNESAEGVVLSRTLENDQYVVGPKQVEDESASYEIQVSRTRDFSETTSVDVPGDGGMIYRVSDEPAYARARLIIDDLTVGQFGPVLVLPKQ